MLFLAVMLIVVMFFVVARSILTTSPRPIIPLLPLLVPLLSSLPLVILLPTELLLPSIVLPLLVLMLLLSPLSRLTLLLLPPVTLVLIPALPQLILRLPAHLIERFQPNLVQKLVLLALPVPQQRLLVAQLGVHFRLAFVLFPHPGRVRFPADCSGRNTVRPGCWAGAGFVVRLVGR
uniref:(northern house mosquito) hypothetical protein n=1 Tax=Culex pipiens TaxID=7175 RepID=A0A8D8FMY7_CULPI